MRGESEMQHSIQDFIDGGTFLSGSFLRREVADDERDLFH
jgi:hypothetical protein